MNLRLAALVAFVISAASLVAAEKAVTPDDLKKYQECTAAATKQETTADQMIEACRQPAEAGIPGAQYAYGVGLLSRNQAGDRTAGIDWLEKSVASGNPAAAFVLADVLLQEDSPASQKRGRILVRQVVCSGYPPAVSALAAQGVTADKIGCSPAPDEDFTGEWIADLKWVKVEPAEKSGPQLKLIFSNDSVQVFMKSDSGWVEVKPGLFKITHMAQSISVSAMETGWDFDGKWIESWTILMLRTEADKASLSFLRTVNNPHVPANLGWRTFSTSPRATQFEVNARTTRLKATRGTARSRNDSEDCRRAASRRNCTSIPRRGRLHAENRTRRDGRSSGCRCSACTSD